MGNKILITGISRGEIYSPNHTNNDEMIFQQVADELNNMGADLQLMNEKAFLESKVEGDVLFSMVRSPKSVEKLIKMEEKGALIINSGTSINNCYRANLTKILINNHIPYPKSIIVKTNDVVWEELNVFEKYPVWIKRGDVHAIHKEDVVLAYSIAETNNVLSEFEKRGIKVAVIMEHIHGDIIKFYGVRESGYFHWFNLLDTNHSKFNIEKDVNSNNHTEFDVNELQLIAEKAAQLAGIYIYGGDVIVRKDGSLCLIDLNDWPSFAPIRDIASKQIAKLIFSMADKYVQEKERNQSFKCQNKIAG